VSTGAGPPFTFTAESVPATRGPSTGPSERSTANRRLGAVLNHAGGELNLTCPAQQMGMTSWFAAIDDATESIAKNIRTALSWSKLALGGF
jgi:hypothetical protein